MCLRLLTNRVNPGLSQGAWVVGTRRRTTTSIPTCRRNGKGLESLPNHL